MLVAGKAKELLHSFHIKFFN